MKDYIQQALVKDFPAVCSEWGGDPHHTCMAFGFDVGDGWHPIIRRMCARLSELDPKPVLNQVKEKWGTLRVYWSAENSVFDKALAIVDEAENDSKHTCEYCGAGGRLRDGGWLKTLCNRCAEGDK